MTHFDLLDLSLILKKSHKFVHLVVMFRNVLHENAILSLPLLPHGLVVAVGP